MEKGKGVTKKFNIKSFFRFADKGTSVDMPLLIITLTLLVFGLIMLYSASYVVGIYRMGDSMHYIKNQMVFAAAGVAVMFLAAKIDYRILRRYSWLVLGLAYVLLVIVLFMPEIKGVRRWIIIPNVLSFQPSEIAKFAIILLFADMIQKKGDKMKTLQHGVIPFGTILAVTALLMLLEPHLSGTVIICAIGVIMMFVGGTDLKWFALGITVIVVGVVAAVVMFPDLVPYAQTRIVAWRNPEADLTGSGLRQATIRVCA